MLNYYSWPTILSIHVTNIGYKAHFKTMQYTYILPILIHTTSTHSHTTQYSYHTHHPVLIHTHPVLRHAIQYSYIPTLSTDTYDPVLIHATHCPYILSSTCIHTTHHPEWYGATTFLDVPVHPTISTTPIIACLHATRKQMLFESPDPDWIPPLHPTNPNLVTDSWPAFFPSCSCSRYGSFCLIGVQWYSAMGQNKSKQKNPHPPQCDKRGNYTMIQFSFGIKLVWPLQLTRTVLDGIEWGLNVGWSHPSLTLCMECGLEGYPPTWRNGPGLDPEWRIRSSWW